MDCFLSLSPSLIFLCFCFVSRSKGERLLRAKTNHHPFDSDDEHSSDDDSSDDDDLLFLLLFLVKSQRVFGGKKE